MGIGVRVGLGGMASGGRNVGIVGPFISVCAGICITGAYPVGVIGKAGVEDEMKGDGAFDCDCCGGWLRYVGLFIVSRGPLIPLRDSGLTAPSDG